MSHKRTMHAHRRFAAPVRWLPLALAACVAVSVCASARADETPADAQPSAQAEQPQASDVSPAADDSSAQPMVVTGAVRSVVVPLFHAPETSRARAAVLRALADHPEVDVRSIDDVTFAAMRLQADAYTPEGRAKLSRELGIDAWLDGQVQDHSASLTLSAGDGSVIQVVTVEADNAAELDSVAGDQMWAALGTRLSVQEERRRMLLAAYELAHRKQEARAAAVEHQSELARERRARAQALLRAQSALAQRKRAALLGEVARQTQLAQRRPPAPAQPQVEPARPVEKAVAAQRPATPKSKRGAAAKRRRAKGHTATAGLTNTGDMGAKKQARAARRKSRARGGAADGGKAKESELLSRQ